MMILCFDNGRRVSYSGSVEGSGGAASVPAASPIDGDIQLGEAILDTAATLIGQPEIAAGVKEAGAIASSAANDVANHKTAVATALDAVNVAATTAPAAIAALPAAIGAKISNAISSAKSSLTWLQELLAEF